MPQREEREIVRQQRPLAQKPPLSLSLRRRLRHRLLSQLELIRGYLATFMDARAAAQPRPNLKEREREERLLSFGAILDRSVGRVSNE